MPISDDMAISLLGIVTAASLVLLVVVIACKRTSLLSGLLGSLVIFGGLGYAFFRAVTSPRVLEGEIASVAISVVLGALGLFVVIGAVVSAYAACVRSMRHVGIRPYNLIGLVTLVGGLAYLVSWPLLNGLDAVFEGSSSRPLFLALGCALVILCVLFCVYLVTCALNMGSSAGNRYDAIIVLGDELRHDDRIDWALAARVDKAVRKLRRCPDAVLVMSGAQGPGEEMSRARAMAEYALDWDVPPERVLLDELSETTDESVANSIGLVRAYRAGEVSVEVSAENRAVYGQVGETIAGFDDEYAPGDVSYSDIPIEEAEGAAVAQPAEKPLRVLLVTTNCELLSALRAAARRGLRCHGVGAPCGPFTFLGRFGVQWFETLAGRA